MKAILFGNKLDGSMLHAVHDGSQSLNHKGKTFRFYRKVKCSHEVGVFVYGKKNPSDDLLTQWGRLLSPSDVFAGPANVSHKRGLGKHEPENPQQHGDTYVRECFRLHALRNRS